MKATRVARRLFGAHSRRASWLRRLVGLLMRGAEGRQHLVELLHEAESSHLIDADTAMMMEGAFLVSEMQVRDIMVPSSRMVFIEEGAGPQDFLPAVIESGHSRFPVLDARHAHVLGILLAKDLLPLAADPAYALDLKDILRPAVFVPESKRLNILLREFKLSRNHLAIVADEYGGIAGIVSIEDVIEQIVGEIDDEHDLEGEGAIRQHRAGRYTVKAQTPIADFNEFFASHLNGEGYDTIGGLVLHEFGRVPSRGEYLEIGGFEFKILRADRRRINVLRVVRKSAGEAADG